MKRCSEEAWAQCPDRHSCEMYAQFADGSECDQFNEKIMRQNDGKPVDPRRFRVVEWVPVTERLPDCDLFVLTIVTAEFKNVRLERAYELASYSADEGWILDNWPEIENPHITHGMELPEQPEVSSQEEN